MSLAYVLLIVAYVAEPCIWLHSMCLRFKRTYNNWIPYISYIAIDVFVTFSKKIINTNIAVNGTFFTFLSLVYVLLFIQFFF